MPDGFAEIEESQRKPSIARVYDYLLDGKDNYAVDRQIGDHFKVNLPGSVAIAHTNRQALVRAVREIAESGIRQFIDLGSGLPTADNVHQVAQRHQPGSAVIYVDSDPIVLSHGRALLAENSTTSVIQADVRRPEDIRRHPETQRLIDFRQPVGIILSAILHHLNDDEDPIGWCATGRTRYPAEATSSSPTSAPDTTRRPAPPRENSWTPSAAAAGARTRRSGLSSATWSCWSRGSSRPRCGARTHPNPMSRP